MAPIVTYYDSRLWRKRLMAAYFDSRPGDLLPYVPAFEYVLINLQEEVTQHGLRLLQTDDARLTALLLQHSRSQWQLHVFEEFTHLFANLAVEPTGRPFIETSLLYVYWTTDSIKQQVAAVFRRISQQTGEVAITTAQRLINDRIETGIEYSERHPGTYETGDGLVFQQPWKRLC